MGKIRIKHFGPIQSGLENNNGWLEIPKITLFIGNQGTGKSSIAKLISTMMWLEKSLYRGELTEKEVTSYNRFVNHYCAYQNIKNYFDKNGATEIEYDGTLYHIQFINNKLSIQFKNNSISEHQYVVPKIMYVPAERNFLSAVKWRNLEKMKELPQALFAFLEELERSQKELTGPIALPIGDATFEFDHLNETANIIGVRYKLKLSEASSGFQSFVPLFLVTQNLTNSIHKAKDISKNGLSTKQLKYIENTTKQILSDEQLSDEVKRTALRMLSAKFKTECFINIVEEIEQNLYPTAQKAMLFNLLESANRTQNNQLILTTHSPYIISFLTLAIKAQTLWQKTRLTTDLQKKLAAIVPQNVCINAKDVVIYSLSEDGTIQLLPTFDGLPSDDNFLNQILAQSNQLFDSLLEIEEVKI
jgi:predicted ATPase